MTDMKVACTGGSGFIGTHLVDSFLDRRIEFVNLDIKPPLKSEHYGYWQRCDILDLEKLKAILSRFRSTHVVHLAARASLEGKALDDFRENTEGTANVLTAIKCTPSVSRVIVTSTQHVRRPGSGFPKDDEEFGPYGLYGQSKVDTEKLTRSSDLSCVWTIIRPTTVWGPWHPHLSHSLLYFMKKGWYLHPAGDKVVRSYGYVGNVVWQIGKLLQASSAIVDRRVYYVGEVPSKQIDWLNAFSRALNGRDVRVVPRRFIRLLAFIGDGLAMMGIKFPMYTSRFRNLTTNNIVPVEPIIKAFGKPPYSLDDGIQRTLQWLRSQGGIWADLT